MHSCWHPCGVGLAHYACCQATFSQHLGCFPILVFCHVVVLSFGSVMVCPSSLCCYRSRSALQIRVVLLPSCAPRNRSSFVARRLQELRFVIGRILGTASQFQSAFLCHAISLLSYLGAAT